MYSYIPPFHIKAFTASRGMVRMSVGTESHKINVLLFLEFYFEFKTWEQSFGVLRSLKYLCEQIIFFEICMPAK